MDAQNIFAGRMAQCRRRVGKSQRVVAAELGISQAQLSNYERALQEPRLEFVCRACDYYGVTADWLLGRTEYDSGVRLKQLAGRLRELADEAENIP